MTTLIPYNSEAVTASQTLETDGPSGREFAYRLPTVAVRRGVALRLNSGGIEFGDPPPLRDMPEVAAQIAFLNRHFQHQCGVWAKYARRFIDLYFAFVETEIAAHRDELLERLAPFGTLYAPEHWSFSALRPLPRAHLPSGAGKEIASGRAGPPELTRVEIAFWTGDGPVAIELIGRGSRLPADARRRARLDDAGIGTVEIGYDLLDRGDPRELRARLPAAFVRFWEAEALPMGPFRTGSALSGAPVRKRA